ncbi:MAG: hypothetical protein HUJ77_01605 [Clostridium sp.]|uniref:hypothetical protein n=1 Tax=Clostridium sp. TaxID=1506 RepID=UPI0025BD3CC5|nr:hypothetical protein [Clostridium sp.]MCF0147073.1 hypothetical protein [Clostridium sp.]
MKLKSIVKYNINNLKNSIGIYYLTFITICLASVLLSGDGNVKSSGIELASVIFLFVAGLNLFKESFYFMKSNNVSRKDFIYGTAISMIPVALFIAIIDIIINRIYNIFIKCPTLYDMGYAIGRGHWDNSVNWVQSNSIITLFNSILFQASLCLFAISLGFLITIIYYRCNKVMKVIISIIPVILFNGVGILGAALFPNLTMNIYKFVQFIFGINPVNVYAAILTFTVVFMIFIGIARLLTRKAVIKQG